MRKMILTAVIALSAMTTFAQQPKGTFTLQPKVVMNIASLTHSHDADPRVGIGGGVEMEYQACDIMSFSAGAFFALHGSKNDNYTEQLDYITVPLMANVYVVKGLAVKLGVQPGFKVYDKQKLKHEDRTVDMNAKNFDFTIPVGLSYELHNVVLDARYNWGLTKIESGTDRRNSVFEISLGYKFKI